MNAPRGESAADDLAPAFAALAAEVRRIERRVVRVPTPTSGDYRTAVIIETAWLTTPGACCYPPTGGPHV